MLGDLDGLSPIYRESMHSRLTENVPFILNISFMTIG